MSLRAVLNFFCLRFRKFGQRKEILMNRFYRSVRYQETILSCNEALLYRF